METTNVSTLQIHKLTKAQYDRELAAGNIDENALYLTPDEEIDLSGYATKDEVNAKADSNHEHTISDVADLQSALDAKSDSTHTHSEYVNQNAFSKVVIDSTTIEADTTTDTLTLAAGSNITLTPDASGDKVTIAATDTVYTHPSSGVTAGTYKSITVDAQGHVTAGTNPTTLAGYGITDAETKGAADTALATAKTYADSAATTAANNVKNDLLNGAGAAYDTLKELGDLIDDNADAIDALETVAAGKADATHSHAISDVTGLQTALDGKAATSHGTHVTYSTTAPVMDGTASAGTASTVARSDHKHPTDTSRASQSDLTSHTGDTTAHITSTERTNWNAAKTHADSAHAPSNAEKNQNAFSNVVVGSTTIAADSATDTLTLVAGGNITLTPDATNDKITIAATDTVYTHPSYTARTGVPTANQTPAFGGTFTVSQPVSDSTGHVTAVNSRTVTIPSTAASTSAAGLMSASDKTKLDGIATGATKITVDSAMSSTSTNPVQNKVVNAAISNLTTEAKTYSDANLATAKAYADDVITRKSQVQADWDQNDTSADDYIKNRPFYDASVETEIYSGEPTFEENSFYMDDGDWLYEAGILASQVTSSDITGGDTVKVAINNQNGYGVANGIDEIEVGTYTVCVSVGVSSSGAFNRLIIHTNDDLSGQQVNIHKVSEGTIKKIDTKYLPDILLAPVTTSGNGSAYTATVSGITALTAGVSFIMVPHVVSTSTQPTLNVNSLGAKYVRRRLSTATGTVLAGNSANWITANKPVRVIYDGTYWVVDLVRPSATDIYGSVPITSGGTGGTSAEAALANLGAVAKAGDTMTGHLHIQSSSYPTVYFEDDDGNGCGSVFASASNKRTYLRCYATDTSYYENYRAPAASTGLTANATYDILTTKTVMYGTTLPTAGQAGRIFFKKVSS